jgi:hypothetical protein
MKQYVGFSRDHSRSMFNITRPAARDFNENIRAIQEAARTNSLDTIVSVVKCGVGPQARVDREITNSNIHVVQPIMESAYVADGSGTPLFDSIGDLIETMSNVPDANDPEVSFLIMAITDGEENASRKWPAKRLGDKIRELQASDRWTFVFRVPTGYGATLARFGIPAGNILEWQQTAQGVAVASAATASAVSSYFVNRSLGVKSTNKFYADLSKVSVNEVKQALCDISKQVTRYYVTAAENGEAIKAFIEKHVPYRIGTVFYQLSKTETVQESKQICICDRVSGAIYNGISARDLLGLPHYGAIRLAPHNLANYDVFVQSTSVNRKLVGDTIVLYCPMFAR